MEGKKDFRGSKCRYCMFESIVQCPNNVVWGGLFLKYKSNRSEMFKSNIYGVARYDCWRNNIMREVCELINRSMGKRVT